MKVRGDFVSNSSSSSFTINHNKLSIQQLAEIMISIVEDDWIDDSTQNDPYGYKETFKECRKNIKDKYVDINYGITLPSTNYTTYIWRGEEGIINVSTCNNQEWNSNHELDSAVIEWGDGSDGGWKEDELESHIFLDARSGRFITGQKIYGTTMIDGDDKYVYVHLDINTGELISFYDDSTAIDSFIIDQYNEEEYAPIIKEWDSIREKITEDLIAEGKEVPPHLKEKIIIGKEE